MKRLFTLAALLAVVSASASACDIDAARMAASQAQNYAQTAAFAGEQARETEDADSRTDDTQDAIAAARNAQAAADQVNYLLADCE